MDVSAALGISLSEVLSIVIILVIMTTLFLIPVLLFLMLLYHKNSSDPFGNPVVFFWQSVLFLRA